MAPTSLRPTRLVGAASLAGGAVAVAMALLGPASAASAADGSAGALSPVDKVSLCHRGIDNVPGKDNGVQPYINTSVSSMISAGHLPDHPLDIIPPFDFLVKENGQGLAVVEYADGTLWTGLTNLGLDDSGKNYELRYAGKNWTPENAALLANGCADPAPVPTTTTPVPDPTTTTPAPDPTTTTPAPDPTTTTPAVPAPTPSVSPSATTEVLADESAANPPDTAVLAETGSIDVQPLLLA